MGYEGRFILNDNAATSTTSAPTAATEGKSSDFLRGRDKMVFELRKGAASGTRTAQVKVFGYRSKYYTQSGVALTKVATGGWSEIFDTGALSSAADFNQSYLLEGVSGFERFDTQIVTNGGTTPTLSTLFGFGIE